MRLLTLVALACSAWAQLVPEVRGLANQGNFAAAEKLLNDAAKSGKGPEWLEAFSWLARGALNNKQYDKAEQYAAKTRESRSSLMAASWTRYSTDWLSNTLG